MKTSPTELWLENQICFPLYAGSRLITKLYTPHLEKLGITYPQYLVLLVLWKEGDSSVSRLSEALFLESNTLTPLLKRMETKGLIQRQRSVDDERRVEIRLTKAGENLQKEAECIPQAIIDGSKGADVTWEEVQALKSTLNKLLNIWNG